jgi:hypothetical protein
VRNQACPHVIGYSAGFPLSLDFGCNRAYSSPQLALWYGWVPSNVRKYGTEQGVSEQETLQNGMEEKSRKFVEPRRGDLLHAVSLIIYQA